MIDMPGAGDGAQAVAWDRNNYRAGHAAVIINAVRSAFGQRRPVIQAVDAVHQRRRSVRFPYFVRGILIGLAIVTVVWVVMG